MLRDFDKKRVLLKIDMLKRYLDELKDMLPSIDEYLEDIIKKRACEKTIELAIETTIDICAMIVSSNRLGMISDEENLFDILVQKKVISANLNKILKEIKGFRNILIHRYGDVDDKRVYDMLSNNLKDFDIFIKTISDFLKK